MFVFDSLSGEMSSFNFSFHDGGKLVFRPSEKPKKSLAFKPMPLFILLGSLVDDEEILSFAESHGPLFGASCWSEAEGAIVEDVADWRAAAEVMACALKMKAFADGKASIEDVREFFRAIVVPGRKGFVVIAGYSFPEVANSSYWSKLKIETSDDSYFNEDGSKVTIDIRVGETLTANIVFTSHSYEPLPQSVLDSERIYADATEFDDFPREDMAECIKSSLALLIQAHTDSVRMGFVNWAYMPLVNKLLTGIWHEFGQAFSGETIGVCKECGKIIDCTNERNRAREYCSKRCRDRARNRRNWRKSKLKKAVADGLSLADAAAMCDMDESEAARLLQV